MVPTHFNTDSFRDLTFDLLSGIANDPARLNALIEAYLKKSSQSSDGEQYTRSLIDKVLALSPVQIDGDQPLKEWSSNKLVLIYFWTFSDIHSAHLMPKLIAIHKRYSSMGVAIVAIHSPKYQHEKSQNNLRHAIDEQSLPFTVLNDDSLQVWKHVGCEIWPTALLFSPDQRPLFIFEGENHVQHLETFLLPILTYYQSQLSKTTNVKTEPSSPFTTKFTYPSHICITSRGYLCISYAGSNQLIWCQLDGKMLEVIGSEQAGLADGDVHQAEFHSPHGLVEYNSCIYVADTNNHAIRVFDPNSRRVLTLIGTGRLGTDKVGGLKRSQQPIASPWDLCMTESPFDHKTVLLISMAGQHQIWAYAFEDTRWWNDIILPKNSCLAIIGNGIEGNQNGLEPMSVSLAAPRGICNGTMFGQPVLFIADSHSSSIRVVTLKEGHVSNLVGADANPKNLSAFGDLDGVGFAAKLQHPLGVAFHYPSLQLYITDTFNNKLKRIDMKTGHCTSDVLGHIENRTKDSDVSELGNFDEPYGLAIDDHYLLVVDKNHSEIKRIDLQQGTIGHCRLTWNHLMNNERIFASKQVYLTIQLDEGLQLCEGNAGTWLIEDKDKFRLCDGQLASRTREQILLDYIPRDKEVARLKYRLMVCDKNDQCQLITGQIYPKDQTDFSIEFRLDLSQN